VRPDLAADAVLEGRDDLAPGRVVLGVRAEDEQHVERQAHGVALDLDVALLHHVEERDLHLAGQVGQLVHREDAAVGARQQAVVDRPLVRQRGAEAGGLDGVDVADDVGHRGVGRRQLLDVTMFARQPGDGRGLAALLQDLPALGAYRRERVVVQLGAGDVRDLLVEQVDELPQDARLRLAAQAQEDEVVAREDGVDDRRRHGLVVAQHAGEQGLTGAQLADEVRPQLVLHAAARQALPTGATQLGEDRGARSVRTLGCRGDVCHAGC